jgi:4-diphosphocytidyl-2-C-methyl-D-erythritol kinase
VPRGGGISITVSGTGAENVPTDKRNLAHAAATIVAKRVGRRPDVALHIEKAVPVAGGMAGGSADAAATLVACNALWEAGLSKAELLKLAAELGSDVPFSLLGGTAIGTGRGQKLNPIITRAQLHWAFGLQDEGLSTPLVYHTFDELNGESELSNSPEPELIRALVAGDSKAVGHYLENDLQPAAIELRPELQHVIDIAHDAGAQAAFVSGSGPTVAALAKSARQAQKIAAKWQAAGVVSGTVVTTSPATGTRVYQTD